MKKHMTRFLMSYTFEYVELHHALNDFWDSFKAKWKQMGTYRL